MNPPEVTLRPLGASDITAAIDLAARAFHEDPLFTHLHPDPSTRQREFSIEHRAYMKRIYLPVGLAEGAVVNDELVGMALWLPPDARKSLTLREWLCLPAILRSVGLRRTRFMLREYSGFDEVWPTDRSFHYLGLIAVSPDAQGMGVGSALLRAGVERAEKDGVGVYLETGTQPNLAFYQKHGFDILREIHLPTAPMHWAMWRPSAR